MRLKNLIGVLFALVLFCSGFFIYGNLSLYFNLASLLIVMGGTLAASFIGFQYDQLQNIIRVLLSAYFKPILKETDVIHILIDLSIRSRIDGILSLQKQENETTILFLRRALGCLVDGYKIDQIRDILSTEMYFFRMRREDSERVLRGIADYCPVFGLIGSVVGMVGMVGGIDNSSVILRSVPIALTSTLYGLIFSNFFFLPFAAIVRERTNKELLLQKIIMEGVIAINSELNPIILKTKLESFLTPSARKIELVSYAKIKERFNIERTEEDKEEREDTKETLKDL